MLAIFGAGLAAGAVNSIAGGGTLLSFPVLLWLGRDPIIANVSNAVALCPGSLASAYAFRRELRAAPRLLRALLPVSIVGSIAGAWLLLATPTRWFSALVPALILLATLLLAFKRPLLAGFAAALGRRRAHAGDRPADVPAASDPVSIAPVGGEGRTNRSLVGLAIGQLFVAVYGGYFGAAMGIMMLATLALAGVTDIHQRNGLKNATSGAINAVAGIFFAARGAVDWSDAALLGAGAIAGGYAGGALGRKLPAKLAEALVVAIGLVAAAAQILRQR
jgi:uncharacterized membrane protein YfcA